MDKEKTVSGHLSLSVFEKWSFTALKTFNNYIAVMTKNSGKVGVS